MPYPELMVKPFREELTAIGFEELTTAEDVDRWVEQNRDGEPALLVINSVCGCAAGMARPGVRLALAAGPRPQRLATVFAGQDVEATAKARGYFADIPPSSPSMALWRGGEIVYFLPRHRIEGRDAGQVAEDLKAAFEEHCAVAAS